LGPELQSIPGVLAFFDHTSIAGKNSCVSYDVDEPIFTSSKVFYAGQAVGVVVAESLGLARRAAAAVKITYKNRRKPILTIREAIQVRPRCFDLSMYIGAWTLWCNIDLSKSSM
jgi:xanthine dehydrogenase molybdopterin-binding subunit B